MNYITPDIEVKQAFEKLENDPQISKFMIGEFNLYAICRFYLEMRFRINYFETQNKAHLKHPSAPVKKIVPTQQAPGLLNRIIRKLTGQKPGQQANSAYDSVFDNPEALNEKVDLLFVATSGFKNADNHSIELQELIAYAKSGNKTIAFVLPDYDRSIKRRPEYDYFYGISTSQTFSFSDRENSHINDFKAFIKNALSFITEKDLSDLSYHISNAWAMSQQLEHIIRKVKPATVIGRSLYSDKWVTMACAKNNVPALEVQHGVFTSDNFYYHPLGTLKPEALLLPQQIACLGEEWLSILRNQSALWNDTNSGLLGSTMNIHKEKNGSGKINVLIAFQDFGTEILDIRNDIELFFKEYGDKLSNFHFTFRIHPANDVSELYFLPQQENIVFSDPRKEPTIAALAKADVLLCATSMMIYEALSFGIHVISFERFRKMTQETGICFVDSTKDLYESLIEHTYSEGSKPTYISALNFTWFNHLTQNPIYS